MNRYIEILKRTQYFEAKNYEITHMAVDETLNEYFENGGNDTYLIFEEKWAIDSENNLSELFAKTTLKKSNEILNLLNEKNDNIDNYVNNIIEKVKLFIQDRERELKLLKNTISNNKNLEQKIGKKQFLLETKKYENKLDEINNYFNKLKNELEKINQVKRDITLIDIGNYDFTKKKDLQRWKEALNKKASLTKNYNIKIKKFLNKIKRAIKRILIAIQEKVVYFIETKYITTKKIIFKAYYKGCEIWYLEKIYDKNEVEKIQVFDNEIKEKLLKNCQ